MTTKSEYLYVETELESWEQVFGLDYKFLKHFLFRGQPEYDFPVLSSFERAMNNLYPGLVDKDVLVVAENEMLEKFKWKFPLYGQNAPQAQNNIEWLAIMQHYGAPTRLIDITRSFFIASYFATSNFNNKDSAVWVFNRMLFNESVFADYRKEYNVKGCGRDELNLHSIKLANAAIGQFYKKDDPIFMSVISPQRANERVLNQQGLFIMQSDIKRPFQEHLDIIVKGHVQMQFADLVSYSKKFSQTEIAVLKIKIPKKITFDVRNSLSTMNISSESLFPGIEGMAKSVLRESFDFRR